MDEGLVEGSREVAEAVDPLAVAEGLMMMEGREDRAGGMAQVMRRPGIDALSVLL